MSRAKVRSHTVHRDGKTYKRRAHTRETEGRKLLQPRRAWRNAKRSGRALKQNRRAAAALFGAAAVSEIGAFTVFRSIGGVLTIAGAGMALIGYGMWKA